MPALTKSALNNNFLTVIARSMAAVSPCDEAIPHPWLEFAEGIQAGEIASRDDTAVALAMTVGREVILL
jgi:hypothetical protein